MEYKFSTVIDASVHDKEGLCLGIDLRVHEAADLEEVGAFRAQEDWRRLVGPLQSPYGGLLGPKFSFITVAVPECLPDRLEVIAYALEIGFIHDDVIDNDIQSASLEEMEATLHDFDAINVRGSSGKAKIAAQIIQEMMSIDRERAMIVAKSWAAGVQHSSRRQQATDFKTLEEYIPYRSLDVGYMLWHGLVTFGCVITIPDEEADEVQKLLTPALITASLTNDLFSFEKERGDTNVQNAILVVMKEHGCGEEASREIVKERIRIECANYVRVVEETNARTDLSLDTKRYIEIMQYTLSGNLAWSTQCLRYHENAKLNEAQMLRAKHGVKSYPATWGPRDGTDSHAATPQINGQLNEGSPMTNMTTRIVRTNSNSVGGPDLADGISGVSGAIDANGASSADRLNGADHSEDSAGVSNVHILNDVNNASTLVSINRDNGAKKLGDGFQNETGFDPTSFMAMALDQELKDLDDTVILQPYHYLKSLPSKGVRDQAIDSLNTWLDVPAESIIRIKGIIQMLHGASLMYEQSSAKIQIRLLYLTRVHFGRPDPNKLTLLILRLDDMQDDSPLRRGWPSTHSVYGTAQTINSATYQYIRATNLASQLKNPACFGIFITEMRQLHVGQSYDLYWRDNTCCPSVPEYLKMVDQKTGGMFCMLARLMLAEGRAEHQISDDDLNLFSCLIGRFFQIRDDYQNLTSADYAQQKGFAEDLDEGKYSFTLIHCIQTLGSHRKFARDAMHLRALLMKRRNEGKLSVEMKTEIFDLMKKSKSLECTLGILRALFAELEREVAVLEEKFGGENFSLRVMLEMIRI